ncbi:MAG: cobalamin-binding protein [Thiotrichales bacterium]|nr:cobalamin-binding protein [Thiotrichales bacterium]
MGNLLQRSVHFGWLSLALFLGCFSFKVYAATETPGAPRIIALAPHLTELVYSAGAGDYLVGVVNYSDYPPAAKQLPVIGSYTAINLEAILQLKPTLILTWRSGNRVQDLAALERLQTRQGVRLVSSDVRRLSDIPDLIEQIGRLAGTEAIAQPKAQALRTELQRLTETYAQRRPLSVFYQIWNQPLLTMGPEQFISQGITLCGGRNLFEDLPGLTGQVALETVIERNPQVILLGGQKAFQNDWYQTWQKYPNLKAVAQQQVHKLDNDLYQRSTERFIYALDPLCQLLEQARQKFEAAP